MVEKYSSKEANQVSILVIGGSGVKACASGIYATRAQVADYLHELARKGGHVDFVAAMTKDEEAMFTTQLDPHLVTVTVGSNYAAKTLTSRLYNYVTEICKILYLARQANGTINFFPAGTAAAFFLPFITRRYVVYFGADPQIRWQEYAQISLLNWIKSRIFAIFGIWTEFFADQVLVRSSIQFQRLNEKRAGSVYVSSPISEAVNVQPARIDSCQNKLIQLLFVGKLSRRKGIEELLQALFLICNKAEFAATEFSLTLVGSTTYQDEPLTVEEIRAIAQNLSIEEKISLVGYVDDLDVLGQLYKNADIFVCPSRAEGFPRVLNEAMSHSLPIVTTCLPEISTTLIDEQQALLVPIKSPKAIAHAISRIITDRQLRQHLIQGAHQWAKENMREHAADQHIRLLFNNSRPLTGDIRKNAVN